MKLEIVYVGILFNAFVSAVVGIIAFAFIVFYFRRWAKLNAEKRAYGLFWLFTAILWITLAVRYLIIAYGFLGISVYISDLIIQSSIFFTAVPLFYYLILRVFRNEFFAVMMSVAGFILGTISIWFLLGQNGFQPLILTTFTADSAINKTSFIIYAIQAVLVFCLLLYDAFYNMVRWWRTRENAMRYESLYSFALIVYVLLGSIDQAKIILDWPLVVFRMLYSATFLFVYLIVIQEEEHKEPYLSQTSEKLTPAQSP